MNLSMMRKNTEYCVQMQLGSCALLSTLYFAASRQSPAWFIVVYLQECPQDQN